MRDIANVLKKNPSSISREIKNNSTNGAYDSGKAQSKAVVKRANSKYCGMKVHGHQWLEKFVQEKMRLWWTPDQIAGHLKKQNNGTVVVSAKSIYQYLYSPYGQSLCKYLPSKRYQRKKRRSKKPQRSLIPDRIGIENRPNIVETRSRFGDFEGDTLGKIKTDTSVIAGLVERKSRYVLLRKASGLKYAMYGFKQLLKPYHYAVQTITFDNGVENARHQELGMPTYFCNPYSSWERGSIENTFQRLRKFLPKGTSIKPYTNQDIFTIADIMNNTPRRCLGYQTPKEVFERELLTFNQSGCCT